MGARNLITAITNEFGSLETRNTTVYPKFTIWKRIAQSIDSRIV
jgi:hypothetical protein